MRKRGQNINDKMKGENSPQKREEKNNILSGMLVWISETYGTTHFGRIKNNNMQWREKICWNWERLTNRKSLWVRAK